MRSATRKVICLSSLLLVSGGVPAARAQSEPHRVLAGEHKLPIVALCFSPDGKTLASAGLDKTIVLWNTETFRARHKFQGHSHVPIALGFSADGKTLHSCGRVIPELELIRWSTTDGTKIDERKLEILITLTSELPAFSRDGRLLATMTTKGLPYVRVWDVATGKVLKEYLTRSVTKLGHRPPSVSFSPDGKTIATAEGFSNTVRLVSVEGDFDETFRDTVKGVRTAIFSPDGKTIAATTSDGRLSDETHVVILDVKTRAAKHRFRIGTGHTNVAFNPDGSLLATLGNKVNVWDTETGKLRKELHAESQEANVQQVARQLADGKWKPSTKGLQRVAFSRDGRWLVTPNGTRVEVWDVTEFE